MSEFDKIVDDQNFQEVLPLSPINYLVAWGLTPISSEVPNPRTGKMGAGDTVTLRDGTRRKVPLVDGLPFPGTRVVVFNSDFE